MGNNPSKKKIDPNTLKWSNKNAQVVQIKQHKHFGKIKSVCCRKSKSDPNSILIVSASQDGKLNISKLTIKLNNKNGVESIKKTKDARIMGIPLPSAWVMTVCFSPSLTHVASGGLDNICSIYPITGNVTWLSGAPEHELVNHTGFISQIKYINDKYLLTSSGDNTVKLWNINQNQVITTLTKASSDITSLDYVYLHNRHVVIYSSIATDPLPNKNKPMIYIQDITKTLYKYENNNDDKKQNILNDDYLTTTTATDDIIYSVETQSFGNRFKSDVTFVSFSPNGSFIAACSNDGTFNIYYKMYHYDHWWNVKRIEWIYLCTRSFTDLLKQNNIIDNHGVNAGTSITWPNNYTVMISGEKTNNLFIAKLIPQTYNKNIVNAVNNAVFEIIRSLPSMKWIGLAKDIASVILYHLSDIDVIDYVIQPRKYPVTNDTRISSLDSCKWGSNNQHEIVVMGAWDTYIHSIISLNQIDNTNDDNDDNAAK